MKRIIPAICLLYISTAAQSQPLQGTLDGELSLDEMSYSGGKMLEVLTDIFIDLEYENSSSITSESDKALIRQAVTTSPHSIVGIEYLESGCEYFNETERDQLSATRLADFFVEGSKEGERVKYEFMTDTYNALSEQARNIVDTKAARLDSEIQPLNSGIGAIPNVDESLQHFYQISLINLIDRYSDFCDGDLEELKNRLQSPNKVFQYTLINPQ